MTALHILIYNDSLQCSSIGVRVLFEYADIPMFNYKQGQTMKPFKQTSINPPVFFSAAALILLLIGLAAFAPDFTQQLFSNTQTWILSHVSWFYILTVAIILLSTFFLAISRY